MKKKLYLIAVLLALVVSVKAQRKIVTDKLQVNELKNAEILATDEKGNIITGGPLKQKSAQEICAEEWETSYSKKLPLLDELVHFERHLAERDEKKYIAGGFGLYLLPTDKGKYRVSENEYHVYLDFDKQYEIYIMKPFGSELRAAPPTMPKLIPVTDWNGTRLDFTNTLVSVFKDKLNPITESIEVLLFIRSDNIGEVETIEKNTKLSVIKQGTQITSICNKIEGVQNEIVKPSGLERVKNTNSGIGWKLIGEPNREVGSNAIDLSIIGNPTPIPLGAIGNNSITIGSLTSATNFNSIAIGTQSTATGQGATALGPKSTAIGQSSTALGYMAKSSESNSLALGYISKASGGRSTAIGPQSIASGERSVALGVSSVGSGSNSVALGTNTKAEFNNSVAIGVFATASGGSSVALGNGTKALKSNSIAIGQIPKALGEESIVIGRGSSATEKRGLVLGVASKATNEDALVIGYLATASGKESTAIGAATKASGEESTAIGNGTRASGERSTALGFASEALSSNSTAIGYNSTASGKESTAIGYISNSEGDYSTAIGYKVVAKSYMEYVVGSYNTDYTPKSTTNWNSEDRQFVIGNGRNTNSEKSDALIIYKNGKIVAPSLDKAEVDTEKSLTTKEYVDGEVEKVKKQKEFYRKYSGNNEIAGYVIFKMKVANKNEVFRLHLNNFKDGDNGLGFSNSIIKVENGAVVDTKSISTDFIGLPQVNYYIQNGVLTIGVSPSADISVKGVLGALESLMKPLSEYEMTITTFENESEYEQKGGDSFYDRIGGDFINYTSKHLVTKEYVDKRRELEDMIIEGGKVVGVRKHVNIPEGVTEISREAFHLGTPGGWQITNVTLPSSLTKIGERAFLSNQIKEIIIPSSVTLIESSAFWDNKLTKVTLPPNCHYKADSFGFNVTVTGGIKDN